MKAIEFLLEYSRQQTANNMGKKILARIPSDDIFYDAVKNVSPEEQVDVALSYLEEMDPTRNKKYVLWIAREYAKGEFRLEDGPRASEVLAYYLDPATKRDFKRRGLVYDLNKYSFNDVRQEVINASRGGVEAGEEQEKSIDPNNLEHANEIRVLYNGPLGFLGIPLSKESSCELGKGTEWCTATSDQNKFKSYNEKGPLFVWIEPSGEKYQFHFETNQYRDKDDRHVSPEKLSEFRTKNPILSKLFKTKEAEISKDPKSAYRYAIDVVKGRFEEAEPYIAKDPGSAYRYADEIIKGRFEEAEPYIAKDPERAYRYAKDVIKGRWPDAEPYIAKDPGLVSLYKRHFGMD